MSDGVLIATITGVFTVVVALIGLYGLYVRPRDKSGGVDPSPTTDLPLNSGDVEKALREHPGVKRLLDNKNWNGAAEAAIAKVCRGVNCFDKGWPRTDTWQRVVNIYAALTKPQKQ